MKKKLFDSSGVRRLVNVDLTPILTCKTRACVRLAFENGWILVRATEPLIRLTVEGESLKVAKEIMQKGVAFVKKLISEMK